MSISAHGTPTSAYLGNSVSGIAVTAGDLIVVTPYSYSNVNQSPTCTDNAAGGSNAYTEAGTGVGNSGGSTSAYGHQFWAKAKATETLTITCTAENDNGIHVAVYTSTNGFPTNPTDGAAVTSSESTSSTSHTSGAASPTGGDSVILACGWFQETTKDRKSVV